MDNTKKIIISSAPRSGGTFIQQILIEIASLDTNSWESVESTGHQYNVAANVCVIRDFRDAALSLYRRNLNTYDLFIEDKDEVHKIFNGIGADLSPKDLYFKHYNYLNMVERISGMQFQRTSDMNSAVQKTCLFIYDQDIMDSVGKNKYETIFTKLEQFFSITISEDDRIRIKTKCNFYRNKYLGDNHAETSSYNEVSWLSKHVHTGGHRLWEKHIHPDFWYMIENCELSKRWNACLESIKNNKLWSPTITTNNKQKVIK